MLYKNIIFFNASVTVLKSQKLQKKKKHNIKLKISAT